MKKNSGIFFCLHNFLESFLLPSFKKLWFQPTCGYFYWKVDRLPSGLEINAGKLSKHW